MAQWALTGGIASGKSTVAALFEAAGVPVVDADRIYHGLIAPGPSGPSALTLQVAQAFRGVLRPDHTLDRAALGALIFEDPKARAQLNAITHPVVHAHAEAQCLALQKAGHPVVLYDIPLLIELNLQTRYAGVVLVMVPEATQLARLMRRDHLDEPAARARLASQWPLEKKRPYAAHIIDNSQSYEHTKSQVSRVAEALMMGTKPAKQADLPPL